MKPQVFQFKDYREYLAARFAYDKQHRRGFSFQFCAKRLGTGKSYLKLVTEKKRHIALSKIRSIADLFGLNEAERNYLTVLVLKSLADEPGLMSYFDEVLRSMYARAHYTSEATPQEAPAASTGIFRTWLTMVIHSMAKFPDFEPSVAYVQSRLIAPGEVDERDIDETLRFLIKEGSLVEKDGRWQGGKLIFRNAEDFDYSSIKINRTGCKLAYDVLENAGRHRPSHFCMMTVGVGKAERERIIQSFIAWRDQTMLTARASQDPTDVLFISANIFAMASRPEAATR